MNLQIASYCSITMDSASEKGKSVAINESNESFTNFAKSIYQKIGVSYPKFFKMDELSKLAFLAGEILLQGTDTANWNGEKVAILLGNRTSSMSSDQKHYESFKNREEYFPSPAIFVYTLPNIMMGELCIRHKIKGENTCFLQNELDAEFLNNYVRDLFINEEYEFCITGWVDYKPDAYEAHLFLVNRTSAAGLSPAFNENFKQLIP